MFDGSAADILAWRMTFRQRDRVVGGWCGY